MKNIAKEVLCALSAAAWIVGLVNQFWSWPMVALYIAISFVMVAVMFGGRLVLKFVPQRNRRR